LLLYYYFINTSKLNAEHSRFFFISLFQLLLRHKKRDKQEELSEIEKMSGHVGVMADRPTAPMKLKSTEFYELVRAIGRFFFIDALFFSRSRSRSLSLSHT